METSATECLESTTLHFDWTFHGIKDLLEASQGNAKSKVTKSMKFGGGRWQILFYANSGTANTDGVAFISLYLSCEPTVEEKDCAVDGKWVREGLFTFGFELRNASKSITFGSKEAKKHSFTSETQNWGWAQFLKREQLYAYPSIRQQDTLVIICTITSAQIVTAPQPTISYRTVPKALLSAVGGLLDDPMYSDVEFILPRKGSKTANARRIYAARKLLSRVEYFDTMFRSGFAEASFNVRMLHAASMRNTDPIEESGGNSIMSQFEDSDDENDEDKMVVDTDIDIGEIDNNTHSQVPSYLESHANDNGTESWTSITGDDGPHEGQVDLDDNPQRNVRAKLSHPSSPRSVDAILTNDVGVQSDIPVPAPRSPQMPPGPLKVQILVEDVAYATYRAVLYYIYTGFITFAPLSSSFHAVAEQSPKLLAGDSTGSASGSQFTISSGQRPHLQHSESTPITGATVPQSRKEWIAQWERNNPVDLPRPCSAKAVYRLADKYDLQELKQRAFRYIIRSLTVDNVAYEVFSSFTATFEDVRKVQVRFFLDNWSEIRRSESMRSVWQEIRIGRHPGFEEVWPIIALQLEYQAPVLEATRDGNAAGGA
ncbi:hypothetical protein POSPLADRAFT_1148932 [Postia placenta MAD-698-R-SB12]|uniref:MATH domain-containing protein n=1 Tax=Postia placenta MAD-698-R-SB12 TaxID=670580 RepID=A0A1X6MUT8_9APHY|nr:hypothetical protein POSPLADRAFT_1148932 [Postia placenta MAD-698-R-SB12]OSX60020.1 hypothetical protein POSPLADRAFT_1148932 [Postia placenta MAD-698-R-SB12]